MSVEVNSITLSSRPRQREGVIAQQVLEEMVLYDTQSEMGYSLNESARQIWDLLTGDRSVQAICDELAEPLEVEPELLHDDVVEAINQFATMGLVLLDHKGATE